MHTDQTVIIPSLPKDFVDRMNTYLTLSATSIPRKWDKKSSRLLKLTAM